MFGSVPGGPGWLVAVLYKSAVLISLYGNIVNWPAHCPPCTHVLPCRSAW